MMCNAVVSMMYTWHVFIILTTALEICIILHGEFALVQLVLYLYVL